MKRLIGAALLAFAAALCITSLYRPAALEQQLLHLQVEQAMPEFAHVLSTEPAALQALFLVYADDPVLLAKARLALLRYPDIARPIFLLYGDTPDFQKVLRTYGEDVVLPIHYFLANEVFTLELMQKLNDTARSALNAVRGLWSGSEPAGGTGRAPLSAEDRGRYAIHFIQEEGYDFLGQFVMAPNGQVAWVQTERVLEGINSFFAGGIKGLETKLRLEEPVGAGDVGWAALDVAIGVSAFKILRMGAATSAGGRTLTFSQRSAALGAGLWRGTAIGARLVKYGAPAVLAYMAVRHPSLVNSLLGSAAEKLGLPVALVQVVGWTFILLPILLVLRFVVGPLAWMMAGLAGLLRWGDRALGRRRGHQA
ncbi:hypothetical protein CSC67_03275 [Pusillimonas caeni]|uniref:hypothetical protein n=1 Tax=Pusillimonas caeni TaxID=1348472 RepID=UPI000E5A0854|nr:hypothetical protein [Pusillimonas caeni]TFL15757.1 hypothetical protein CSC67_03275 [Pusillimonas caeni]